MYIQYRLRAGQIIQDNEVVFGDNPTEEEIKEWLNKELECLVIKTSGIGDMGSIKAVVRDHPDTFFYEYRIMP